MERLEKSFVKNGCYYFLYKRIGTVALFELRYIAEGKDIGYETAIIQARPAGSIGGRDYPERERLPSNEEFGRYGWSFCTLDAAEAKFDKLVEERHG